MNKQVHRNISRSESILKQTSLVEEIPGPLELTKETYLQKYSGSASSRISFGRHASTTIRTKVLPLFTKITFQA